MPFGIIEVHTDKLLPGTEQLMSDETTDRSIEEVHTRSLKRVMYKVHTFLVPFECCTGDTTDTKFE